MMATVIASGELLEIKAEEIRPFDTIILDNCVRHVEDRVLRYGDTIVFGVTSVDGIHKGEWSLHETRIVFVVRNG